MCSHVSDAGDVQGRFLHHCHIVDLAKPSDLCRKEINIGSGRVVVDHNRDRNRFPDLPVVLEEFVVGWARIKWRNDHYAVCTQFLGFAREFDHIKCRFSPCPDYDGNPTLHLADTDFGDLLAFLTADGQKLPGAAEWNETVNALFDLPIDEAAQCCRVDRFSVGCERCDQYSVVPTKSAHPSAFTPLSSHIIQKIFIVYTINI